MMKGLGLARLAGLGHVSSLTTFVQGNAAYRIGTAAVTCIPRRCASTEQSTEVEPPPVIVSHKNMVMTIQMNRPAKLNAWNGTMMNALFNEAFKEAASDPNTKAVVVTGTGRYFCAGVDLSQMIKLMHPRTLHGLIYKNNLQMFDNFLSFPKPILIACNGPAVGASVTSATLCDMVIATEETTFNTPFAALGVPKEGCSSYHFPLILGEETAERMLGPEGWKPTAKEAKDIGLIEQVVHAEELMGTAQSIAEGWVAEGKGRQIKNVEISSVLQKYKDINEAESQALATAFLSHDFLNAQYNFLKSKGKMQAAKIFQVLVMTRFLWSRLM